MNYPEVTDVDIAFGIVPDKKMISKAMEAGFYNGNTKYNDMFSKLFFNGGSLKFKKDLNKEFAEKALRYYKAVAVSFGSKHEEKEAVCAMVLSELVEIK